MAFRKLVPFDEIWDGEMRGVNLDGHKVLLVKLGADVYAYEDRCAHLGVALSQGTLAGDVLTCSAHHYQYDVRTGHGVNPRSARMKPMPVLIRDGMILVDTDGSGT
jgi:toluene monooxygenase system ferredoxin subunit